MNLNARIHPFANRLNRREILKGPPNGETEDSVKQRAPDPVVPHVDSKPEARLPPPPPLSCSTSAWNNDEGTEQQFSRAIHLLNLAVRDVTRGDSNGFIFSSGKLSTMVSKASSSSGRQFAHIAPVRIIVFDDAVVMEDFNGQESRQQYLDYVAGREGREDETIRHCAVMQGSGGDTVLYFSGSAVRNRIVGDVCKTYLPKCLSAAYPEGVVVDGVWCRGAAASSSSATRWSGMTSSGPSEGGRRLGGSTMETQLGVLGGGSTMRDKGSPVLGDDVREKRLHHLAQRESDCARHGSLPHSPSAPASTHRAPPTRRDPSEGKGDVVVLTPVGKYHFCRRSTPEAWSDLLAWLTRELRASGHVDISEQQIVLRRASVGFNVIDDYAATISNTSQVIRCSFVL